MGEPDGADMTGEEEAQQPVEMEEREEGSRKDGMDWGVSVCVCVYLECHDGVSFTWRG